MYKNRYTKTKKKRKKKIRRVEGKKKKKIQFRFFSFYIIEHFRGVAGLDDVSEFAVIFEFNVRSF